MHISCRPVPTSMALLPTSMAVKESQLHIS